MNLKNVDTSLALKQNQSNPIQPGSDIFRLLSWQHKSLYRSSQHIGYLLGFCKQTSPAVGPTHGNIVRSCDLAGQGVKDRGLWDTGPWKRNQPG